jgi:hypothetical protein
LVPAHGQWWCAFQRGGEGIVASEPHAAALLTQIGETYFREQLSLQRVRPCLAWASASVRWSRTAIGGDVE